MAEVDELKKLLEEKKKEKEGEEGIEKEEYEGEEIKEEALGKILNRLTDKYKKEGILTDEEIPERTAELRRLMRGEREYKIGRATADQLKTSGNPMVRFFGKIYQAIKLPFGKLESLLEGSIGKNLERNLTAGRMDYSVEQYLALTIAATVFLTLITFTAFFILNFLGFISLMISTLIVLTLPLLTLAVAMLIPQSRANRVGKEVEKQLPFALRHMSIQVRAGVGIYDTMESIANSDYGRLSEGFRWVLDNIEKGMSTEDALEAWGRRTKSQSVRRVVGHIVRAIRTGGNLSNIMVEIAEDVSFERRTKIADFAEKLNLLGLFLMMSAIVFPVMIAILSAIGSAPQIQKYLGFFSIFSPTFLMLVFFILVPSMLGIFLFYVRVSDPGAI